MRHPLKYIRLEPTNVLSAESLSFWKLPDSRHAAKHPWRPPDQVSDVMGGENTIPGPAALGRTSPVLMS
jgi:hypothetical protein